MTERSVVLKVLGIGTRDLWREPLYLQAYDPDDGVIEPVFTADVRRALVFDDAGFALLRYRAVDPSDPVRSDGFPNRPLTAYTIAIEAAP